MAFSLEAMLSALRGGNKDKADQARAQALGSGAASSAANTISLRKQYNDYAIDKQSNGEAPVSFENYAKGAR